MSGARSYHTAHELRFARIYYRHHPFFEQEVEIVRRLRQQVEPCMVVQLADGLQLAIPSWMLDPLRCQSLRDEAVPVIAIDALRQLVDLVDQHRLSPKHNGDSPCSSNHQGGNDEQGSALPPTGAADA